MTGAAAGAACAASASAVCRKTDARGITSTYSYDGLNRVVGVTYSDATPPVSYAYDAGGAGANALGRLTSVTVGSGTPALAAESYTYDQLGRITQAQESVGGVGYPVGYSYNPDNSLATITYPSGRVVAQSYDAIGRLATIASGATNYLSGLAYNAAGQATGFNYGNGVQAAFSYNDHLQLATLRYSKSGAPDLLGLAYDYRLVVNGATVNNGQIQKLRWCTTAPSLTCTDDPTRTENFSYDAWGRLSTAQTSNTTAQSTWGLSWNYDRFGNRLNQNVTAGQAFGTSVSVDANTNRINSAGYAYDAAGNMIWDAIHDYAYDAENRLTVVDPQLNPVAASYTYLGALRVKKVAGATSTVYVYSGTKPVQEYENGSLKREYIYAGGGPMLATVTWNSGTATTTYEHPDHLSIRAESDASGNLIRSTGHFPFGEQWYDTSPGSKWQFTTYERDTESGLDYADYRFYSSRLGRFMQQDPLAGQLGDPESLDRYSYVLNNPVSYVDPFGLDASFGGCVGVVEVDVVDGKAFVTTILWCDGFGGGGGAGMHGLLLDAPFGAAGGNAKGNCDLTLSERLRLAGEAVINLNSAAEKIGAAGAAGVSTPLTGPAGVAAAVYEGVTAGPTVATGALQGVAAITGNRDIAEASNVSAIFTSVSGPITLVASGGNTEAASTASTLEALFTFGLSGAVSDVGIGKIADAVSSALDLVSPMTKPPGCK